MRRQRAFTLIELMVVVAVLSIIALLAAPSFNDLIAMQRLKSVNAQLVTDLQFARSEAASRNLLVRLRFENDAARSCYSVNTAARNVCSCLSTPVCADPVNELRTVQVLTSDSVRVVTPAGQSVTDFAFDPATGAISIVSSDSRAPPPQQFDIDTYVDAARKLRTVVNLAGRPSVCKPTGSTMPVPACP